MLGEKVNTENGLDFYVFPQEELTDAEEQRSINIMVIGETGVGKSTWLHCFLNYLQGIQIEEKNRYYLFDEKKLQEKYNLDHPNEQKTSGSSVTDKPAIYNLNIIILIKKRFIFINILYFYKIIIFLFIIFGIKFKQFIIINKIR